MIPGAFGLGLIVGSFLNVVIHRLPRGLSIVFPPSHCPRCEHRIRWHQNIPLVSFAALRGRCAACGNPIAWRYPAVELATGLLFAVTAALEPEPLVLAAELVWVSLLVVVTMVDLEHQIIPDVITYPGM